MVAYYLLETTLVSSDRSAAPPASEARVTKSIDSRPTDPVPRYAIAAWAKVFMARSPA